MAIGVLAIVGTLAAIGDAKGQAAPTITVEIAEAELRAKLPADGELIARGEISKDYVGLALGRASGFGGSGSSSPMSQSAPGA